MKLLFPSVHDTFCTDHNQLGSLWQDCERFLSCQMMPLAAEVEKQMSGHSHSTMH